jgi:hypothetical protein
MGLATKISGLGDMRSLTLRMAFCCAAIATALPCPGDGTKHASRAERAYDTSLEAWRKAPTNSALAVAVARTAFEWAEFAQRDEQRAQLANQGIGAAREAIRIESTNGAAHYWLGMNIGQLARTKWLGALPLVKDMSAAFFRAREIDPGIDYAGPDRSLGLLYRDAPGWPTSVGDKKKARLHLERAAKIAPAFPENQLCLLESYEKWGERTAFERQLSIAEQACAQGRKMFTGEKWEKEWNDWETRLQAMKSKATAVGRMTLPKGAVR